MCIRDSAAVKMRENWPTIPKFFEVEISDYGQVISALDGCDAVISLASRPSAANYVEEDVVQTNTMSMWNVCRAAEQLKVRRVALGSSYNAVGAMGTAARRAWAVMGRCIPPVLRSQLTASGFSAMRRRRRDRNQGTSELLADRVISRSP